MEIKVEIARIEDLTDIARLFGEYRKFYGKEAEPESEKNYVLQRMQAGDSHLCAARDEKGEIVGFAQCYFTFSSLSMCKVLILNDLYVSPSARGRNVAKKIIEHVIGFSKKEGFRGIALETAASNTIARKIYEDFGFTKDDSFLHYFLKV
ncbi:GNAT family N-acetyltransferase [Leptospira gomenensis]|uniref:GNAT family N-acetyltransferase n=1 Tax=Leptospira gomenensis TaxID=2484974 RepID=A0A5F1YI43_9LEPT|nr:GNAT family N-acetyltransferase [Leptospira gomenensis]TGK34572.1 GNAT family N-acetyltransferase [Leptospira gomenensis]TGK40118.1 GNAT family N-acetyltransferase [Leptospira gomenensis]TGK40472.1 GNAT family N-acetyltransferase [Leptospira gomenensis]TGK55627.1 GNAT family N-acetyltransferase [Leptospira gomenensis]